MACEFRQLELELGLEVEGDLRFKDRSTRGCNGALRESLAVRMRVVGKRRRGSVMDGEVKVGRHGSFSLQVGESLNR